jgi:hypothetical protein
MHRGERLDDQLAAMRNHFIRNFSNCLKRVALRFQGLKTRCIAVDEYRNSMSQQALRVTRPFDCKFITKFIILIFINKIRIRLRLAILKDLSNYKMVPLLVP